MTRRRATYVAGEGLLMVDKDRLLFAKTADHGAVPELVTAAWSDRPLRLLAAAVVSADFEVPSFVFCQQDAKLQGIVCGIIEVEVTDSGRSLIRGETADTWNQFVESATSAVSLGDDIPEDMWIEVGIVRANAFRWATAEHATLAFTPAMPSGQSTQPVEETPGDDPTKPAQVEEPAEVSTAQSAPPAPSDDPDQAGAGDSVPAGVAEPSVLGTEGDDETVHDATLLEASRDVEGDLTIVAPRPGATTGASAAEHRSRVSALARRLAGNRGATRSEHTNRQRDPEVRPVSDEGDADSTLDIEPGEIFLDEPEPRRTVEARVCLDCDHPSPPAAVHCGACDASIVESGGEIRVISQPSLGVIHLSGDRVESLDVDLLIGRNPAREPLKPHQRAVIHGTGDRSVSRRHIELRLDGWQVVVTSLKADEHTVVDSSRGHQTPLPPGVPRTLEVGDTVRYGGSWFRYEGGP